MSIATHSMPEFITTKGTAHYLEQIITGARERLVLISPYLQISEVFLQRLQDAAGRGVATTIVYGKDELKPGERAKLAQLPSLHLLYLGNLHAKCYFNEAIMVITSMNMYEASEKNREMGILLRAGQPAYGAGVTEAESIMRAAQPKALTGPAAPRVAARQPLVVTRGIHSTPAGSNGFCIRCHRGIGQAPDRPLCIDCYQVWADYQNPDYAERFCHKCGDEADVTMRKPLCSDCFAVAGWRPNSL